MEKTLEVAALTALFMLASAAAPALAQPDPGQKVALQTAPQLDVGASARKSPWAALGLSLGTTAAPLAASFVMVFYGGGDGRDALLATGMIVGGLGLAFGPSSGLFYAGDTRRALGMDLGRLGLMVGGIALELAAVGMDRDQGFGQTICLFAGIAAGTTALALAIWDIAAAPGAARRANKRLRLRQRLAGLTLGPLVTDSGAGKRGYGLALGGRF